MYCNRCNKYISDSTKNRCDYCGAYLENQNIMPTPTRNTTIAELPRGDVVNYLYIVKSLECVRAEMKKRINQNLQNIKAYREPVYLPETKAEKEEEVPSLTVPSNSLFRHIDFSTTILSSIFAVGTFVVLMIFYLICFSVADRSENANPIVTSEVFRNTVFWVILAISVGILFVGLILTFFINPPKNRNKAITKYNKELRQYSNILNENQKKQSKYNDACASREAKIRQLEKENELKAQQEEREMEKNKQYLSEIESQLSGAYSLNIIPVQHRTLEATIYLHDYMASSREKFSDTLFHLDFKNSTEVIARHMQNINQQLLANQALINAVNGTVNSLYSQNRDIQDSIDKTNSLLKKIKPFDDQNKTK